MMYTDPEGFLRSPGYPQKYPNLANCTYFFNISEATSIEFTRITFRTQASNDLVYFGSGSVVQIENAVQQLSGPWYFTPPRFEIGGGMAWVYFTSDIDINYQGFEFSWQALFDGK